MRLQDIPCRGCLSRPCACASLATPGDLLRDHLFSAIGGAPSRSTLRRILRAGQVRSAAALPLSSPPLEADEERLDALYAVLASFEGFALAGEP